MRTQLIVLLILVCFVAAPVSAQDTPTPDVAEIDWVFYDECQNVFWWRSSAEINIPGYRVENPAGGWTGDYINAGNYGTVRGLTYAIIGPLHADMSGDYWLRVYFDNGTSRMEDVAGRVCDWTPEE